MSLESSQFFAGYSARFVQSLSQRHQCPICLLAMRDPVQTECGHLFCRCCLIPVLASDHPVCPLDKTDTVRDKIFSDNACKREILSLEVYCDAAANGCSWIGTLKQLENHTALCEYCNVLCRQCGLGIPRKDLSVHQSSECPMRSTECQYCRETAPFGQMEAHLERVCPEVLRSCPNHCDCNLHLKLSELNTHLDRVAGDCPLAKVYCPYKAYGCSFVCQRNKLAHHLESLTVHHLYMQADHAAKMRDELSNAAMAVELIDGRTSALEKSLSSLEGLQRTLEKRINSLHGTNEQSTTLQGSVIKQQSMLALSGRYSGFKSAAVTDNMAKTSEIAEKVESIISKTNEIDQGLDKCLSSCLDQELRLQLLERAAYDGVLLWKIDEFGRRRKEAINGVTMSLYSVPFYTSRHGYKMCARVYLNGDGMGKGTHLSFFFVVMKGPFDALLPWPFRQKVTLTIINQTGKKHVTDSFRPDTQSSSFQRPTQKEMNIASGCPMFIRLDHLLSGGFVKDDCIFLKVEVEQGSLRQ